MPVSSEDSKSYEPDFPSERYCGSTVYLTPYKATIDGICHRRLCVGKASDLELMNMKIESMFLSVRVKAELKQCCRDSSYMTNVVVMASSTTTFGRHGSAVDGSLLTTRFMGRIPVWPWPVLVLALR